MSEFDNKCWFPFYTKPKHEKRAYEKLIAEGYEAYLPLTKSIRKWSDRKKTIQEPLIKSYVFAKVYKKDLYKILSLYGISRYISFNGKPAIIRNSEIESLKKLIDSETKIEVTDGLVDIGEKVKIKSGPMAGLEGEIIEHKGKNKLVLKLESIGKSLLVTIETGKITNYLSNDNL